MSAQVPLLLEALAVLTIAMIVIKYACDQFQPAADFLARGMAPGIKGATINAIGSSMPEFLTSMAFLFTIAKLENRLEIADALTAAIAVTAGSAIFNTLIIPAAVILTVTFWGLKSASGTRARVRYIEVGQETIFRDGFFLITAEALLIWLLGYSLFTWSTGALLIGAYLLYLIYLFRQNRRAASPGEPDERPPPPDPRPERSTLGKLLRCDLIALLYPGQPFTARMAWTILGLATLLLSIACHFLAEAVVDTAEALRVPVYFTSMILAAAATSIPDTVLSIQDARRGNYDDAISNALGSNIFDITICLGVPILLYTLLFGAIDLAGLADVERHLRDLRVVLLVVTLATIWLLVNFRRVGVGSALLLLGMYALWLGWIGTQLVPG